MQRALWLMPNLSVRCRPRVLKLNSRAWNGSDDRSPK